VNADPFAGLDQRLFTDSNKQTTKQRSSETSLPRDNETTPLRTSEAAQPAAGARPNALSIETTRSNNSETTPARNNARRTEPAKQSESRTTRTAERHTHDLYTDQIHWMNRLKLDLAEQHGAKVTSNSIVQLAVDVLRADFMRKGEHSKLFRALVRGTEAPEEEAQP